MAQTPNRSTNMIRRQSFNGKGLTFVEVIFAQSITDSATTPESKDSVFDKVTKVIGKNGNLLGCSYRLAAAATANDAAEVSEITAGNSIDSFQFIVEGTPGQFNENDSVGDTNIDVTATIVADAEADIEADIRAVLDSDSSDNTQHVKVRTLLPEGHNNGDANTFVGMFDQRGDA
jgi:hypothetical protein